MTELLERHHLEPQTGMGLEMRRGQTLRVIDPQGEQVSDLLAFNAADRRECLSSGRSIDYNDTIYLTTGHVLYSNRSSPMLTIVEDRVGRHDFLLTPCSPEMFRILYRHVGHHPSCFENLATSLAPYGISSDALPTTFNIFMDVAVAHDGALSIGPPRSRPGDFIDLRAEMDLVVGVTACSAEKSNNGSFKPIDLEVRAAPTIRS
ncbi:MAG: urea carboxylase-associated family protein [Chloroflexota bacterium]|nr:urea carboxylase-associated family protein [Chloroflexota bacterium]